ncbi:serine/threonine protein kinase [Myxococcota bacterium]|nr:serine/threonine protein kinase [Myxococcota bacterium]
MRPEDSSSTRARLYAPTPVAESWSLVTNKQGAPSERLARRFAFVEQILRMCCALLDAERHARKLQPPSDRRQLIRQLDTPTFGLRANAVKALAEVIRVGAPTSVLAPLAVTLTDETSTLYRGLSRLVDARNRWAHDGLKSVTDEESRITLAETHGETLAVAGIVELLVDAPIVVVEHVERPLKGPPVGKIISFIGADPLVFDHPDPPPLAPRRPYMLTQAGLAVPLTPWLMFGRFNQATEHLRLLDRADKERGVGRFLRGDEPSAQPHPEVEANLRDPVALDELMGELFGPDPKVASLWAALVAPRTGSTPQSLSLPGYRVGRLLGRGASGAVWEATRLDDGRVVALKVLRPELMESPERRARLAREYRVLVGLSHPGVARVYSLLDDTPHGPVLEMERVNGRPLSSVVNEAPLRPLDAARLCAQLLDALGAVHAANVVHRDLKPENILIQADGSPRLVDFGIAHRVEGERLTSTLDRLGTQGFAAPEQHRGDEVDARADLYAVGRLLVWMCGAADVGALPGGLQRVVRRAIQARASDRYPNAASLHDDLRALIQHGWEGPPVGPGDLLPGGLRLVRQLGSPRSGVYLFRAEPLGGGHEVAVLVSGTDPSERQAFRAAFKAAGDDTLRAMRCNGARVSEDGLHFAELHGESAEEHATRLFGAVETSSAWDKLPSADDVFAGVGAAAAVGAAALGALFVKRSLDERAKAASAAQASAQASAQAAAPKAAPQDAAPKASAPKAAAGASAASTATRLAGAALGGLLLHKTLSRGGVDEPERPAPTPSAAPSAPAVLTQAQLIGLLLVALSHGTREHFVNKELWGRLCKTPLASLAVLLGPEAESFAGPVGDGLTQLSGRGQALLTLSKLKQPGVEVESIQAAVKLVRALREVFRQASAKVSPETLAPFARRSSESWEVAFVQGQSVTWTKALPLKG